MRPHTLSEASDRIRDGEPLWKAIAEWLDTFYALRDSASRLAAIDEEPAATGDARHDALMGAIAEYLARQFTVGRVPAWTAGPRRRLRHPWFTTDATDPGLLEYLAFASPAEFRSRNIFTDERPLRRAGTLGALRSRAGDRHAAVSEPATGTD